MEVVVLRQLHVVFAIVQYLCIRQQLVLWFLYFHNTTVPATILNPAHILMVLNWPRGAETGNYTTSILPPPPW